MTIKPTFNQTNLNAIAGPALPAAPATPGGSFDAALRKSQATGLPINEDDDKTLREAANQLVATTFVMPLLEQIRDDPFRSELFHGGRTEEIFQQQLNTILADRIVEGSNMPLAESVYQSMAGLASKHASQNKQTGGMDLHG